LDFGLRTLVSGLWCCRPLVTAQRDKVENQTQDPRPKTKAPSSKFKNKNQEGNQKIT
jgi:hypothetical protein